MYGLQRNLLVENIIDMYQSENRKPIFKKVEVKSREADFGYSQFFS